MSLKIKNNSSTTQFKVRVGTTEVSLAKGGALSSAFADQELENISKAIAPYPDLEIIFPSEGGSDDVIVGDKDNATSLRIRGLQHSSEGTAKVQNYAGIFTNASYDTVGTLKTRASWGGNAEMDLAFQSPHALLLIAQDGAQTDGVIKALSQNGVEFHTQYSAEELSPKRLVTNRVSTATKGSANTSDVTLGSNAGKVYMQHGHVDGGIVFPPYSDAEQAALTPVIGEVIYNTTSNELKVYNGSSFVAMNA